jgi:hypothetical protein
MAIKYWAIIEKNATWTSLDKQENGMNITF